MGVNGSKGAKLFSAMPNMPTFWYMLRRWGTLKRCSGSGSTTENPLVPKKPGAATPYEALPCGSRVWHCVQVKSPASIWRVLDVNMSRPACWSGVNELSRVRIGLGG